MANAAKAVNLVPSFGINDPMDSGTANIVLPGLLAKQSRIARNLLNSSPCIPGTSAIVSKLPRAPLSSQESILAICFIVIVAVSLLSWKYFEKPIDRFGHAIALRQH